MPQPLIVINQGVKPPGVAGVAREDLDLGVNIALTVVGGPYKAYVWSILDRPVDWLIPAQSTALLATPTAPATIMQNIDRQGTFLIALSVDSGFGVGARPEDNTRITFYAGAPLNPVPNALPRRMPAFGEKTEHNVHDATVFPSGNPRGWATEMERWFLMFGTAIVPPVGTGEVSVATLAALAALPVAGYVQGQPAFVRTLDGVWRWHPGAVAAADAITVIADLPGTGRWLRAPVASRKWLKQVDWYVDGAGGSNEADGATAGTPLASLTELQRRVAPHGTWAPTQTARVFLSNLATNTMPPITIDTTVAAVSFFPNITGITFPDVWALITARNFAANGLNQANVTLGAPLEGDILQLTTTGVNVRAIVAVRQGGAVCRLTMAYDVVADAVSVADPTVGDAYEVRILPQLRIGGGFQVTGAFGVVVRDMSVVGVNGNVMDGGGALRFLGCKMTDVGIKNSSAAACYFVTSVFAGGVTAVRCAFLSCLIAPGTAGNTIRDSYLGTFTAARDLVQIGENASLILDGNNECSAGNTCSPIKSVGRGGSCWVAGANTLYGLSGLVFDMSYPNFTLFAIGTAWTFAGTSGTDFAFGGLGDSFFPPYPVAGGPFAAAIIVNDLAVTFAGAPFNGRAATHAWAGVRIIGQ